MATRRLAATIKIARLNTDAHKECVICYTDMMPGDRIIQFACHENHQIKEDCYINLVKHFEQNNKTLHCPMCRAPVEKDKV